MKGDVIRNLRPVRGAAQGHVQGHCLGSGKADWLWVLCSVPSPHHPKAPWRPYGGTQSLHYGYAQKLSQKWRNHRQTRLSLTPGGRDGIGLAVTAGFS